MKKAVEQFVDESRFHRQLHVAPPDALKIPIHVIGAGGIGSFTVLSLAKMGCPNISVYDFDLIENHNLPNQFYRESDIGKPKVKALAEIVKQFTGFTINPINEKYEAQPLKGIVISAVDSMDVRLAIWPNIKYKAPIRLFVDGRMGAEVINLYSINPTDPDDIKMYEHKDVLFPSSEAHQARCTERAIIYTALTIASLITGTVKRFCMKQEYKKRIIVDNTNFMMFT